jgi:hypothetical protein
MRSLVAGSDAIAKAGKVFLELEHARAKEGLARSALNRRWVQGGQGESEGHVPSAPAAPPSVPRVSIPPSLPPSLPPSFPPSLNTTPASEIERLELERQVRGLRVEVSRLAASLEAEGDRARWVGGGGVGVLPVLCCLQLPCGCGCGCMGLPSTRTPPHPLFPMPRWAESELREAQTRLELSLASSVGVYKSALWVRRLEQLKSR